MAIIAVALRPAGDSQALAQVGKPAPDFVAVDLNGNRVSLSDFKGQPVVLNFWASWCTPCRREFSLLKKVDRAQVLGVVFDDTAGSARGFASEQNATWPSVLDPEGKIAAAYRVAKKPGIPVTVFIDASGKVTRIQLGELRAADLGQG